MQILIKYPLTLSAGEHRFFQEGIKIDSTNGLHCIHFRIPGVVVLGPDSKTPNRVELPRSHNSLRIGLSYTLEQDPLNSPVAKKDFGVVLTRYKIHPIRVVVLILAIVTCLSPLIIFLCHEISGLTLGVQLKFEQIGLVTLPLALLSGVFFTGRRILLVMNCLLRTGINVEVPSGSFGDKCYIEIKETSERDDATLTIDSL